MASDDLFSIVNAPSGSLTPVSTGRPVELASAFFSPEGGGVPVEDSASTLLDQPVQWGPSLVLIRDHTKSVEDNMGLRRTICFCCIDITIN